METKKTFFMHESELNVVKPIPKMKKGELDKEDFLKNFIIQLGSGSLKDRGFGKIKIPIQSIFREEVRDARLDLASILPRVKPKVTKATLAESTFYEKSIPIRAASQEKTLPPLQDKRKRNLPNLLDKKSRKESHSIFKKSKAQPRRIVPAQVTSNRVYSKEGVFYYKPFGKVQFKKYGIIDPLIVDKGITRISCVDLDIRVDYGRHTNLPTGFKFNKPKDVNKFLKKLAKVVGIEVSEEEPLLDIELPEGFRVHANYGTDFIDPNFEMVRLKYYL
jgi:hypothetical protein